MTHPDQAGHPPAPLRALRVERGRRAGGPAWVCGCRRAPSGRSVGDQRGHQPRRPRPHDDRAASPATGRGGQGGGGGVAPRRPPMALREAPAARSSAMTARSGSARGDPGHPGTPASGPAERRGGAATSGSRAWTGAPGLVSMSRCFAGSCLQVCRSSLSRPLWSWPSCWASRRGGPPAGSPSSPPSRPRAQRGCSPPTRPHDPPG